MDTKEKTETPVVNLSPYDSMRIAEAKHIVKNAMQAGVTKTIIIDSADKEAYGLHAMPKADGNFRQPSELGAFVLSARTTWANMGCFIVIDGGTQDNRDWLAMAFMYRGIIAHARQMGRLGITLTTSEIMSQAIGLPSRKATVVDLLTRVPVLWFKDVQPTGTLIGGKDSDGRTIFDGVLSGREQAKKPTIITIDGDHMDLNSDQADQWGNKKGVKERYGHKFDRIMGKLVLEESIGWRFRAK